jgi:hypothetical protein
MFALIQQLADLAANATSTPLRPVPRLDNDLALPDQLRVMVGDLLTAGASPETLREATSLIHSTAHVL